MTAREIASLWIVAVAAVFVLIWDHRNQSGAILSALGGPSKPSLANGAQTVLLGPSTSLTTNGATPMAGNEFGALATYGNRFDGSTQANGSDSAFGNIFNDLSGG
jgi:hypothetical protein